MTEFHTVGWTLPHMKMPPLEAATHGTVRVELAQAEVELGNAIAMHRSAWVKAKQRQDEIEADYDERNPDASERRRKAELAAITETDRKMSNRMGDVKFWAAERAACAATVSALVDMLSVRPRVAYRDMAPPRQRAEWDAANRQ